MKILIVVQHALYRRCFGLLLSTFYNPLEIIEAGDVRTALRQISDASCDLVILDMDSPGMDNLSGLEKLRKRAPELPIIIFSASTEIEMIRSAIDLGARGYLLKSSTEAGLKYALSMALAGETYIPSIVLTRTADRARAAGRMQRFSEDNPLSTFTDRQIDVLKMVMKGLSNAEIARRLGLLESTVKTHVKVIMTKLGAANRTQAAVIGTELGCLRVEDIPSSARVLAARRPKSK